MDPKRAPDDRVATIASRQHGVVSIGQLRAAGLSPTAVRGRIRTGRLHRLHRGVYAVGHVAPSDERHWMAAVLAVSGASPAVLSHRSAAALWDLLPVPGGPVEVSLAARTGRRARAGLRIHRPRALAPAQMTRRRGIPVTTPARTIADLRRVASPGQVRRAIRQAEFLGLQLGPDVELDGTRSELERAFLRLCRQYGLPTPKVNRRIGPLTVDFCWQDEKLVVETDGWRFHRGRAAFEDDRNRELILRRRGYEVARLSYRQVLERPAEVAASLAGRLKGRGDP